MLRDDAIKKGLIKPKDKEEADRFGMDFQPVNIPKSERPNVSTTPKYRHKKKSR